MGGKKKKKRKATKKGPKKTKKKVVKATKRAGSKKKTKSASKSKPAKRKGAKLNNASIKRALHELSVKVLSENQVNWYPDGVIVSVTKDGGYLVVYDEYRKIKPVQPTSLAKK